MSVSQIGALERENARLSSALEQSNAALTELQSDYQVLKQQLEWFKRQLFGEKSEKRLDIDPVEQGSLLGALGVEEPPGEPHSATATVTGVNPLSRRKAPRVGPPVPIGRGRRAGRGKPGCSPL